MQPFRKLLEVLQFNSKPTTNFAVLTYYKAAAQAKPRVGNATLKKESRLLLDRLFFAASLKAHHWLATFLDPHFKRFEFLPITTVLGMKFRSKKICFLMSISGHCKIWQKSLQKFHKLKSLIPPKREQGWKGHKILSVISAMGPTAVSIPTVCKPVSTTKTFYVRCVTVCFVSIMHRLFRLHEQSLV